MALSKATEIPKIEVVYDWNVQVATDTVIKEEYDNIINHKDRMSQILKISFDLTNLSLATLIT